MCAILVNNRAKYRIFNDDMQGQVQSSSHCYRRHEDHGTTFMNQRCSSTALGPPARAWRIRFTPGGFVRLTPEEAKERIWLIDRNGLVTDDMPGLPVTRQPTRDRASEVADWETIGWRPIGLLGDYSPRPTILIGSSADLTFTHQGCHRSLSEGASAQ